jgi:hypothetical protein
MTDPQWRETADYMKTRLPKLTVWVRKNFPSDIERKSVADGWAQLFYGVTIEAARAAIDEFAANESLHPMSPGDLPMRIARAAREYRADRKRKYIDGVETFECPHCEDCGFVLVWSLEATRKAKAGTLTTDNVSYGKCAVPCSCVRGCVPKAQGPYRDVTQRFDPQQMFPLKPIPYTLPNGEDSVVLGQCDEPEQLAAFQAWVDGKMKPKQHSEFTAFS